MTRSDLPIAAIILISLFAAFAAGQTATTWAPDVSYSVGALVTDNGVTYQCLQAHLSQADWAPHNTPALWSMIPSTTATPSTAPATAAPTTSAPTVAPTTSAPATAAPITAAPAPSSGNATCTGTPLHVAANIDVCLPHVVCTSEVCPPTLGQCVNGVCQYKPGYSGLQTTPEAWTTYYCTLSTGGCHGVTQIDFPEVTAAKISTALSKPICESYTGTGVCIGIAASSPMVVGNSQVAIDPSTGKEVAKWGMGLTEASGALCHTDLAIPRLNSCAGLCYSLTGPGGSAIVALTDRCGGYCKCGGSGFQECGPCVSAADMQPNCPCVGTEDGVECCGLGCAITRQECDWYVNFAVRDNDDL
jgi:hypothetical protein